MHPLVRPLDPRSTLTGLALAGALVLLPSLTVPAPPIKTIRLNEDPDPASVVRIGEGKSFTVPPKLRLVIKAVGGGGGASTGALVQIDGATVFNSSSSDSAALAVLDFPLVAQAGEVVGCEVVFSDPERPAFVTGYLSE